MGGSLRRFGVLCLALVAFSTGAIAGAGVSAQRPTVSRITRSSPAACYRGVANAKALRFKGLDGAVVGKGRVGIVLVHQDSETMCEWKPFVPFWVKRGYRVLALNLGGRRDDSNVRLGVQALRALEARKVVLIGASRGGTAVLVAAGEIPVDGVVSLSGPAIFGSMNAIEGVERNRAPLILGAAYGDSQFDQDANDLYKVAVAQEKQLVEIDGYSHGVELLGLSANAPIDKAILALLAKVRG
jgi:pimeloyl-ACP methyl ester carboxylesterase